jgi:hypothetical protein
MKRFLSFWSVLVYTFLGICFPLLVSAASLVAEQYYPNYKIQGKRTKMIEILENIEASVRV